MTTVDRIQPILTRTYGDSDMVHELAKHLGMKIDQWPEGTHRYGARTREDMIRLTCWDWFSGGLTAERVAERIEAALS